MEGRIDPRKIGESMTSPIICRRWYVGGEGTAMRTVVHDGGEPDAPSGSPTGSSLPNTIVRDGARRRIGARAGGFSFGGVGTPGR